jgi:hypothetical protein
LFSNMMWMPSFLSSTRVQSVFQTPSLTVLRLFCGAKGLTSFWSSSVPVNWVRLQKSAQILQHWQSVHLHMYRCGIMHLGTSKQFFWKHFKSLSFSQHGFPSKV